MGLHKCGEIPTDDDDVKCTDEMVQFSDAVCLSWHNDYHQNQSLDAKPLIEKIVEYDFPSKMQRKPFKDLVAFLYDKWRNRKDYDLFNLWEWDGADDWDSSKSSLRFKWISLCEPQFHGWYEEVRRAKGAKAK